MGLLKITELGEGLDYSCPCCGAEVNEPCTEFDTETELGHEIGMYIHRERYDVWSNDL